MNSINKFWIDFCQKHHISPNALEGAYAYGANSQDADILSDLINRKIKTATTSVYDHNEDVPIVGIMPFKNVNAEHAYLEGEGDRSYEYWYKVHKKFFTWECKEAGKDFTEDTEVVCETFIKVD